MRKEGKEQEKKRTIITGGGKKTRTAIEVPQP